MARYAVEHPDRNDYPQPEDWNWIPVHQGILMEREGIGSGEALRALLLRIAAAGGDLEVVHHAVVAGRDRSIPDGQVR